MTRLARICFAVLGPVLLIANACAADVIYKVRLKDGSIAYTDRPPLDATVLERRQFDTPVAPPEAPEKAAPPPVAAGASGLPGGADSATQRELEIAEARRAVTEAKARLEKGREPIEGDFIATANKGHLRHSPAYEERVQALEKGVAEAEAHLAKLERGNAGR
jgi:hypothetical protein